MRLPQGCVRAVTWRLPRTRPNRLVSFRRLPRRPRPRRPVSHRCSGLRPTRPRQPPMLSVPHSRSATLRSANMLWLAMSRASVRLPLSQTRSVWSGTDHPLKRVAHPIVREGQLHVRANRHHHQRRPVVSGQPAKEARCRGRELPRHSHFERVLIDHEHEKSSTARALIRADGHPVRIDGPRRRGRRPVHELGGHDAAWLTCDRHREVFGGQTAQRLPLPVEHGRLHAHDLDTGAKGRRLGRDCFLRRCEGRTAQERRHDRPCRFSSWLTLRPAVTRALVTAAGSDLVFAFAAPARGCFASRRPRGCSSTRTKARTDSTARR